MIFPDFKVPSERSLFKNLKTGLTFLHMWFFNFQNLVRSCQHIGGTPCRFYTFIIQLFGNLLIFWFSLANLTLVWMETFEKNMKSFKYSNKIFWNNIHFALLTVLLCRYSFLKDQQNKMHDHVFCMFYKRIKSKFTLTRKKKEHGWYSPG